MAEIKTAARVARNSVFLFTGEVVSKAAFLILTFFIARFLGDRGFGKFAFALSFTSIFMIFADMGLTTLTIREVAKEKNNAARYIGNVALMKIALALFTWLFIFAAINLMKYPRDTTCAVYLMGIAMIASSFTEAFSSVFRAYEKMEYVSFLSIFQKITCAVLGILVLAKGGKLLGAVYAYLVASVLTFLLAVLILMGKFVKPEFEINLRLWKDLIKEACPIGLAVFFSAVYFRIDTVLLSLLEGDAVVGWYNAAYKPMEAMMFVPISFIGALFPIFSNFYASSRQALVIVYTKAVKILLIIILPVAIGTTVLAPRLIRLFYGVQFANSAAALRILIWACVVIFVNYVLTQLLIAMGKQKFNARFTLICAGFNIILNLMLIPLLSYIGASIVTLVTEALLFGLCFYVVSKELEVIPLIGIAIKPLIASLFMASVLLLIRQAPLMLTIPLSAAVYGIAILLLRTFDRSDFLILKEAVKE